VSGDTHKPQETSPSTLVMVMDTRYLLYEETSTPFHYNGFSKRMVMGYVNCKIFRVLYSAHKVTDAPAFAAVNTERQLRLLHLFKAQHLSNHQRWYTFVEKQRLFATLGAEFILWTLWNILKRIHILVVFSVWWSTRIPKTSTTHHVIFMTCGSFVWQVVTLR